ncbi:MAG: cysteine--tRNA ligase [Kiritimatiellae bacterium]|nr:cysteine--tRNA ligase [Kiritimatiellia bacterium]
MALRVYNTLSRRVEAFVPLEGRQVRMYTCGPTVYDFAHIGNFRSYAFEDLLRRYLRFSGYTVRQVMNLTDVDDKTIRGARESGLALNAYTETYTEAFFADLKTLNIQPAEHYPAATRHIPEMIALIERLFENGYAYRSQDGSVYFSIRKFAGYGRLGRPDMSGMRPGARVSQDEYEKENVADFALWKAWDAEDGDVAWASPWGKGRPGWHIECSAMSMKYLGPSLDVHAGGIDLIFPHHDDEIAQSEGATGKPFVKYWLHCAHLIVDGRKMSKSLGNFHTLRQILEKGYTGREVRYVLISAHYRQTLDFRFEALDAARGALERLDEFQRRLRETAGSAAAGELPGWAQRAEGEFRDGLDDDLNISRALAALFDMVHEGNRQLDSAAVAAAEAAAVLALLARFDEVLGFLSESEQEAGADVLALVRRREQARKAKDYAAADRLRDELAAKGWTVKDTPGGPKIGRSQKS